MKRILGILLPALLIATVACFSPLTAFAENDEKTYPLTGTTGECTWTIDSSGTLTISGNGAMENSMIHPWFYDESGVKIKRAVIEHGVTNIGAWAFADCGELESVTIPDTVTSVGESVFIFCVKLSSVTVDVNNPVFDSRDNCNAVIETNTNTLVAGVNATVIPGSVEAIGQTAFADCYNLKSITIPDSVKEIKTAAFFDSIHLESVTLPDSLTSIERLAFFGCESLKRIKIPDSVTYISENTFHENTTICGTKDSYAIKYAKENKLKWEICSKCPACGKLLFETDKLPVPGYDPTYTRDGLTDGVKCALCGEWLIEQQVIPKLKGEASMGDANGDGVVDIFDATLIQKYAVDKIAFNDEQKEVADVNNDGIVDIFDATDIQKFSVDKITEFKKKA